jgi:hypothetical protein
MAETSPAMTKKRLIFKRLGEPENAGCFFSQALRRPHRGRLEGWPRAVVASIHRDAAKRPLLRMRAEIASQSDVFGHLARARERLTVIAATTQRTL